MTPAEVHAAFEPPNELPKLPNVVSTGSLGLDLALGIKGWPLKQISVIYGETWTGKTTLALSTTREMQKLGTVAYVTAHNDFSPDYAARCGVDLSNLILMPQVPDPVLFEDCPVPIEFLVVDDVSDDLGQFLVTEFQASWSSVTVLAVSQVRAAISYPYTRNTPGSLTNASVRVRLQKYAGRFDAEVTRNPWRPGLASCTFDIGDHGIDHAGEVLQIALSQGLIHTQGSWLYMGTHLLGQGQAVAHRALQEHPELLEYLDDLLRRGMSYRAS